MSGIPMSGRLTQFDGGEIVDNIQNAPILGQARRFQSRVIGEQNIELSDQIMARALQRGQDSPQDWDAEMRKAADAGVPEAANLIGQYNPLKAADMLRRIEGAAPPQAVSRAAGGRNDTISSLSTGTPTIAGGGPSGSYNFDAVPPDVLKTRYQGLGTFIDMMRDKPRPTYQDLASTIAFLKANGHPEAENLMNGPDGVTPINFDQKIAPLLRNAKAIHDQLGQRFAPEQMGLPYQDAAPDRKVSMSEAGPVEVETPAGGGAATSRFVPVGGSANPAFLPKPSATGAAAGGPPIPYDETGKPIISPDDRKRLKYAVDLLRRTNHVPPLGFGARGQHDRDLVYAMAGEASEATGGAGGDIATVSDIKADQKSLGQLQKQADAVFSFEKTLKKNLDVVKANMPEGVGTELGPWINRWVQSGRTEFGSTKVPPYVASILVAMNEFAKITEGSTGAAGASVESRRATNEMLNGNYSKGAVMALLNDTIYPDLENRKQGYQEQLAEIRARIAKSTSTGPSAAPALDTDVTPPKETVPSWYKPPKK